MVQLSRTGTRRASVLTAVGVATALVISGCATGTDDAVETSDVTAGGVLRIGMLLDSQGLDPALTTESTAGVIDSAIYDTLLEIDADGNLQGRLATEWETSEDGLTVTLTMREGVEFSDGTPLTAEDAAYTLNRIKTLEGSPRSSLLATISSVEAPDDTTLVINLSAPFAPLLTNLTQFWSAIVSEDTVDEFGDLNENPVGSGPFMLDSWDKDTRLTLVANPNYWRSDDGFPYLEGVEFTFNATSASRIASLESNEVDFLYNVDTTQVPTLEDEGIFEFYGQGLGSSWMYMLLNQQWGPFQDEKVRQAIYTALDRQAIADLCQPGVSTALNGGFITPSADAGIKEPVFTTDLDAAKELLDETDYADGFEFTINALTGYDFQICTAEVIQSQLAEIGITANINVTDFASISAGYTGDVANGSFEAMTIGWGGTPDPDQRLSQVFQTGGGANYVGYSNEDVDALLKQARESSDPAERAELYVEAQTIITETGPYAFLYTYDLIHTSSDVVEGFESNPSSADNFASLYKTWIASP